MSGISKDPATRPPNIIGKRFRYDKAIAQTFSEHYTMIEESANRMYEGKTSSTIPDDLVLDVIFKDGCDGIQEVDQWNGPTFRSLPNMCPVLTKPGTCWQI